jgi:uroporphyrin-III C-methyltransferase
VTFVTGHTKDGVEPDWRSLAAGRTTLVIYMGIGRLPVIVDELIAAGMPPQTPAAAIQNATLPSQDSVVSPLRDLPRAVREAHIASPAIVVIGEVVRFAQSAVSEASAAQVFAKRQKGR